MGLSHLSILGAHPDVSLDAVCDSSGFVLDILNKYTGTHGADDYYAMLDKVPLDAVVIATPTKAHFPMVKAALDKGLHVFCEKPLTLSAEESRTLAALAAEKGLVSQVGYHNRFVAAFGEAKKLLDAHVIGDISHALAEAYGPVVLRPKGGTWRSKRSEGGGCLYDYAAHPLDLLTWYLGEPSGVGGTVLGKVFSADTEDEVYSSLFYPGGTTAQLSVNWSDESYRKMTTKVTLWGSKGRITVDRQECQVFLRDTATPPDGYRHGWNVRYTTELTPPVWFYVRGEEYSAELDYFVRSVADTLPQGETTGLNSFGSAAVTDQVIEQMIADHLTPRAVPSAGAGQVLAAAGHVPGSRRAAARRLAARGLAQARTRIAQIKQLRGGRSR